MFNRFIIFFFFVYLISRFFSETLGLVPKYFDLIDLPIIFIFGIALIFPLRHRKYVINEKLILTTTNYLLLVCFISVILNFKNIFLPSAVLFVVANLGGPVLFLTIEKYSKDKDVLAKGVERMFLMLLIINIIVVITINLPIFVLTGNPDVISGTYGKNAYQFSVLLIIMGTYFLGKSFILKRPVYYIIITQFFIFGIFYLMQYRAALPFFILSYMVVVLLIYKLRVLKILIPIIIVVFIAILIADIFVEKANSDLGYDIWTAVLSDPLRFLNYGKAISYKQTFLMLYQNPEYIPFGCGPGNFLSRAFYTFGWDLVASFQKDKGVGMIIAQIFNMTSPRFPFLYLKYISVQTNTGNFMGTNQLSSPHVSILANISEIGIFGFILVLTFYIFIFNRAIHYFRFSERYNKNLIPLNIALIASSLYLLMLGFIDIYYEVLRMTLPVWLLFWVNSYKFKQLTKSIENENN